MVAFHAYLKAREAPRGKKTCGFRRGRATALTLPRAPHMKPVTRAKREVLDAHSDEVDVYMTLPSRE